MILLRHVGLVEGWSIVRDLGPTDHADPEPVATPGALRVRAFTTAVPGISQDGDPEILRREFPGAELVVERDLSRDELLAGLSEPADVVHVLGSGFRDAGGRQVLATRLPDLSDTVSAAAVLDALKSRASASLSPW